MNVKQVFKDFLKGDKLPSTETRKLIFALTVIITVFGFFHWFIYIVTSRSMHYGYLLDVYRIILTIGLISMPVGFFSNRYQNKQAYALSWVGYVWMGFFNLLFVFTMVEFFVFLFTGHGYSYWAIIAALVVAAYALRNGLKYPAISVHKFKSEKIKNLRLVQISDLHIGMLHLDDHWLNHVVGQINALKPDILAVTGDLVEGEFDEISPMLYPLKKLDSNMLKFYTTGNHEYLHGGGPWESKLAELGFTSLHNENTIVDVHNQKILVAGVPDRMIRRFVKGKRSSPDVALYTTTRVDYKILLAHEPSSVRDIRQEYCDIMLAGHTHGGQIFPFHFFVKLVQPVVAGFKTVKKTLVFAHQGTGFWGPPMRWFSKSEIVLFIWE